MGTRNDAGQSPQCCGFGSSSAASGSTCSPKGVKPLDGSRTSGAIPRSPSGSENSCDGTRARRSSRWRTRGRGAGRSQIRMGERATGETHAASLIPVRSSTVRPAHSREGQGPVFTQRKWVRSLKHVSTSAVPQPHLFCFIRTARPADGRSTDIRFHSANFVLNHAQMNLQSL
jgi:hypothetical protein